MADFNKNGEWKGYTYDQLQFHRMLTLAKLELEKGKLTSKTQMVRSGQFSPKTLVGRVLGALDYVDYAIIAFRVGRKLLKMFKR